MYFHLQMIVNPNFKEQTMRTTQTIHMYNNGTVLERNTDKFTKRMDLDGHIYRANPENRLYAIFFDDGSSTSWIGTEPLYWGKNPIVNEEFTRTYEIEVDYS
jgi:hypothetical protein